MWTCEFCFSCYPDYEKCYPLGDKPRCDACARTKRGEIDVFPKHLRDAFYRNMYDSDMKMVFGESYKNRIGHK